MKRHLAGPSVPTSAPGSFQKPSQMKDNCEQLGAADDEDFSSLRLQGGDTTRHIYRYAEKRERERVESQGPSKLRRSRSVSLPKPDAHESIQGINVPGGFRRDHLRRTAGSPASSGGNRGRDYGALDRIHEESSQLYPRVVTSNFIEFLTLYGHFAGEDLDEDDEALEPEEYFSSGTYDDTARHGEDGRSEDGWGEESALLAPGKRKRRRKNREAGNGTPLGAALLLLKSFVGTGVLFLPRAFYNGGMLFSNIILLVIAGLSYYCFILLVSTRQRVPASYGDMGKRIYGQTFCNMINFSLVISQVGFASAYIVFVSENLQAFVLAVSKCRRGFDVFWYIVVQAMIFLPISLYRNINNIQKMALVADLFIMLGLIYLYYSDIKTIVERPGVADIQNFNGSTWTLLIGTAIFTFEGVGLIIPIQCGMRDPSKFPRVLAIVMLIISVIFISAGALSYAAYGSATKTVILLNMPQDDRLVNGVQLLYSLAILMSTPLQIYPAIEITSQQLFSRTGKYNPWIKWQKNIFRFLVVVFCACLAWAGANDLDKFVSLVGSFACIPLVYIYPVRPPRSPPPRPATDPPSQPLMHYKVAATRRWQRPVNLLLVLFGFCMMIYTTALTVQSWVAGGRPKSPSYCDEL